MGCEVMLAGSFPDDLNNNLILRKFVYNGLVSLLSKDRVIESSFKKIEDNINLYRPKLLILFGSCPTSVTYFDGISKLAKQFQTKIAIWFHDDPYEFDWNYLGSEIADYLFTNDKWSLIHYNRDKVYHLPLAANRESHYRNVSSDFLFDVFFCGVAFSNRRLLIDDLSAVLTKYNTKIMGSGWSDTHKFTTNSRISNKELADLTNRSLCTLYIGRDLNLANTRYMIDPSTPGPRLFEAAMSGAVQLVFHTSYEILDYFSDGEGIILYDNPTQFNEILESLIRNKEYRQEVAVAGQSRALDFHSYTNRCSSLLDICGIS